MERWRFARQRSTFRTMRVCIRCHGRASMPVTRWTTNIRPANSDYPGCVRGAATSFQRGRARLFKRLQRPVAVSRQPGRGVGRLRFRGTWARIRKSIDIVRRFCRDSRVSANSNSRAPVVQYVSALSDPVSTVFSVSLSRA